MIRAVGRFTARIYQSIDPDVIRHLAFSPLMAYSLFSSRTEKIHPQKPDGYPPLIFVHGLGGSRGDFLLMAGYFWLKGRSRAYRIHFRRGQTIPQMAQALARFIQKVKKATDEKKVEIVAHSLGGVISRIAVSDHDLASSVKTLVTLGAPHQGTHSARLLNTANLRDLRPNSDFMKKLCRKKWPKGVRGLSFWSRNDLLIVPPESAKLSGMQSVETTPFTHYSYLIDPRSWREVYDRMAQ